MKICNETEVESVIAERQKSLKSDVSLYSTQEPMAAEVAKWGIELLEKIKAEIKAISFDATISQYKSPRTGEKN